MAIETFQSSNFKSTTTGFEDLDSILAELPDKVKKRVVRSAVGAQMAVMRKAVRREIGSTPGISPQLKRPMKAAVGSRYKRNRRTHVKEAKVGFGVGRQKGTAKRSGKNKGGVGINKRNAHWFAVGTKSRYENGAYRGRIESMDAVGRAVRNDAEISVGAARAKAYARLELELVKLGATP